MRSKILSLFLIMAMIIGMISNITMAVSYNSIRILDSSSEYGLAIKDLDGNISQGKDIKSPMVIDLSWEDGITKVTNTWDSGGTIKTAGELAQFGYNIKNKKNYSGQTISLENDINLSEKSWIPIGNNLSSPFSGTFDGNNYEITGLKIGTDDTPYDDNNSIRLGLFAYLGKGIIKNLGVEVEINSGHEGAFLGGLVSYNAGGKIINCYSKGIIRGASFSNGNIGGLVGFNRGKIINSYSKVNISNSKKRILVV